SPPSNVDWVTVSDYAAEYQGGTPATGWQYDWNSTGKLGNSAAFSPLKWSEIEQAYNTTGVATTVPGATRHPDDYLNLGSNGGHPGPPGYLPIFGYTIQSGDGAGDYRLIDSAIRKSDDVVSADTEDGLQVLVYVNNALIGPAQYVSTDGTMAIFDRAL